MSDKEILKWWNWGLTREQVAKMYMKEYNKKAKSKTNVTRTTKEQALKHVEPILFEYRMKQLKIAK